MKFKIELHKIGRNKVDKNFDILVENKEDALSYVYAEVKKYLISSDVELIESKEDDIYYVYAGYHKVGSVVIKEVKT